MICITDSALSEIIQKENAPQISCSGPRAQSVKDAALSQP